METDDTRAADASLHKALREWEVKDALPPRFEERVWQRIARAEAQAPVALWMQVLNQLSQAFSRPRFAVCYVTLLLLAGLLAGYWQARAEQVQASEALGTRYVQMMDPYSMPAPR